MAARKAASATRSLDALAGNDRPWAAGLTRAAFFLTVTIVIARLLMLEVARESADVVPGAAAPPRGPGAAVGLGLDLLSCVPALLVLLRASVDNHFALRRSIAFATTAAVGVCIAASVFWASDRFLTVINASHWVAALALLWATAQVVRSWARARVVAGVAFGLLLCLTAHGLIYRLVDVPDMRRDWEERKTQILQERNWPPDSFMARQFEIRVLGGNIQGFNTSPNTFAALLVTLGVVAAGVAAQRLGDRDEWGWPIAIFAVFPLVAFNLWFTGSKTGFVTPLIAAGLVTLGWLFRNQIVGRRKGVFRGCVGVVGLAILAIVAHGLYYGSLPSDSLAFRWKYWVGSARLFAEHPWLGVGWGNFGANYLAFRLPEAAEEIKDPHNIAVRFATELGTVGLLLFVGWVLSLAWAMTRPALPIERAIEPAHDRIPPKPALLGLLGLVGAGVTLNIACSIDFAENPAWVTIEILRRLLFLALLLVGATVVSFRSSRRQEIDDRPGRLMLYATTAAVAAFLLHNMVDVPMSEPGATALFGLLAGTVLGLRGAEHAWRGKAAAIAGAAMALTWAAAVFALGTLWVAEDFANDGDNRLRANDPRRAAESYAAAFDAGFVANADYAYRHARALLFAGADPASAHAALDRAIATDPTAAVYRRTRAMMLLSSTTPDVELIRADFLAVLSLNPNDVQTRLDFAAILQRLGDRDGALNQYREALRYDDLLDAAEPKRLTKPQIDDIQIRIGTLLGT